MTRREIFKTLIAAMFAPKLPKPALPRPRLTIQRLSSPLTFTSDVAQSYTLTWPTGFDVPTQHSVEIIGLRSPRDGAAHE